MFGRRNGKKDNNSFENWDNMEELGYDEPEVYPNTEYNNPNYHQYESEYGYQEQNLNHEAEYDYNKRHRKINLSKIFFILALIPIVYLIASRIQLQRINYYTVDNYIKDFDTFTQNLSQKEEDELYNKQLLEGEFNTGQPPEFKREETHNGEVVKIDESVRDPIGAIYIPKIDIAYPIYDGTSVWALEHGVGLMEKTSRPGGMGTNSVLTAHRGTQNGDFFRHLDKLKDNDIVYLLYNGEVLKYVINGSTIIQPNQGNTIKVDPNRDQLTLLTCTPYLLNTDRLLYFADRANLMVNENNYVVNKLKNVNKPGYVRIVETVTAQKDNNHAQIEEIEQQFDRDFGTWLATNTGTILMVMLSVIVIIALIAIIRKILKKRCEEKNDEQILQETNY